MNATDPEAERASTLRIDPVLHTLATLANKLFCSRQTLFRSQDLPSTVPPHAEGAVHMALTSRVATGEGNWSSGMHELESEVRTSLAFASDGPVLASGSTVAPPAPALDAPPNPPWFVT